MQANQILIMKLKVLTQAIKRTTNPENPTEDNQNTENNANNSNNQTNS